MAAPVVTGSCALLAGLFPNDGADKLRARVLGGVKRTDALAGTCTSDGQLDVVRAATDPYPVVDALEPAADGTLEATVRGSWFGEDRGRVTLDGAELEVRSWGANEVRVVLPPSLESKQRYVQVERADGDTGRRKVAVGSEEGFDFFEPAGPRLQKPGPSRAYAVQCMVDGGGCWPRVRGAPLRVVRWQGKERFAGIRPRLGIVVGAASCHGYA